MFEYHFILVFASESPTGTEKFFYIVFDIRRSSEVDKASGKFTFLLVPR